MNTGIETLPVVFASTTDAALVRREVREGRLRRVDRGTYLHIDSARAGWQQAEDVIRARCLGLQQRCRGGTVVSHATAALLHGLPVPTSRILDVSHSFLRATRTEAAFPVTRHIRELTEEDVVTLDGVLVTSLERTVIYCACAVRPDWPLVAAEAALRQCARVDRRHRAGRGTSIDDLRSSWLELLERSGPRRGRVQARAVLGLCDPLAESAGESRARCVFLADGLPPPLLQAPIGLEGGTAFSDFAWALDDSGRMLHGEYDGLGKYTSPSTAAESGKASIHARATAAGEGQRDPSDAAAVVVAEKGREDAIRERGHEVLRVDKDDLATWQRRRALAARFRRKLPEALLADAICQRPLQSPRFWPGGSPHPLRG